MTVFGDSRPGATRRTWTAGVASRPRGRGPPPLAPTRGMASIDPMTTTHDPLNQPNPRIAANVMHFARLLRRAGLPVGPAETIAAQEALTHIDLAAKTQAC